MVVLRHRSTAGARRVTIQTGCRPTAVVGLAGTRQRLECNGRATDDGWQTARPVGDFPCGPTAALELACRTTAARCVLMKIPRRQTAQPKLSFQGDNSVARVLLSQSGWVTETGPSSRHRLWWHSKPHPSAEGPTHGAAIVVKVRETGAMVEEKIPNYLKVSMSLMYGNQRRTALLGLLHAKAVLRRMTCNHTARFDRKESARDIAGFVEYHHLNMDEALHPVSHFETFNQFFYRKLKPGVRPIHKPADPSWAVLPADARTMVFDSLAASRELWIKGDNFALETLLQDTALASDFEGCALMISRLAPQVCVRCAGLFVCVHGFCCSRSAPSAYAPEGAGG